MACFENVREHQGGRDEQQVHEHNVEARKRPVELHGGSKHRRMQVEEADWRDRPNDRRREEKQPEEVRATQGRPPDRLTQQPTSSSTQAALVVCLRVSGALRGLDLRHFASVSVERGREQGLCTVNIQRSDLLV